jgi:DNA-binding MarR family transcriptional regulator
MAFTIRTPPSKESLQRLKEKIPTVDPNAVDLSIRFRICAGQLEEFMTRRLEEFGLSQARFSTLMFLLKSPHHRAKPIEIATYLGVTRGNMTGLLDNLERDGLINRADDPQDRRINYVHLKEKALKLLNKMLPDYFESVQKLVQTLSKDEREVFLKCLEKLQDGMRKHKEKIKTKP